MAAQSKLGTIFQAENHMSCKVAGIMRIFFVFAIASLAVLSCSRERIDIPEEGQIQPGR